MSLTKKDATRLNKLLMQVQFPKPDMTDEEKKRVDDATTLALKKWREAVEGLAAKGKFAITDLKLMKADEAAPDDDEGQVDESQRYKQFEDVQEAWNDFMAEAEKKQTELDEREAKLLDNVMRRQKEYIEEGKARRSALIREGEELKKKVIEEAQAQAKVLRSPFMDRFNRGARGHA